MDHRYIDENSFAARYIDNALPPKDREVFEKHLVDCQECTDRVLLAGMFHARQPSPSPSQNSLPLRAKFAARFTPIQLVVIFVIAAMLLLAIPSFVMLYLR